MAAAEGEGPARRAVDAAEAWAESHLILLSASFESFTETGEWARIEGLQHRFEVEGRLLDVGRLAWRMPPPLGLVEQGHVVLLCRALLHVPAASTLLEDWFRTVKHAYDCWIGDPNCELISHEVVELLDGDVDRARRVSRLLLREGWMFSSGTGGAEGYWTRELRSDIRVARDARNARELLDARLRYEDAEAPAALPLTEMDEDPVPPPAPPGEPTGSQDTAAHQGRLHRLWRYVSNNPLLATFLGTLGVAAVLALLAGGRKLAEAIDHGSAPAARGKLERAAEDGARTFSVPGSLAREGPPVRAGERVRVLCRVYAPNPPSVVPDGNWYRISSSPWNGRYFAAANSFWNGDVPGQLPYTHNTDQSVQKCH
ncbi:MAG TPA: hypothetical protein VH275_04705 [Solirubrobacterales bacterium]|nr:hypothetical protein [Solirubrobacterales bacterium]